MCTGCCPRARQAGQAPARCRSASQWLAFPRGAAAMRLVCAGFVVLVACGSAQPLAGSPATTQTPPDAGSVPPAIDGGQPPETDGGTDAGPVGAPDAGTPDAGPTGGSPDAGNPPPSSDAGPPSGSGAWIPVGPGGGSIRDIAVKPDDPDVALVGTLNGVFRTTNGGLRWEDTGIRAYLGLQTVAFSADGRRAWALDFDGALYSSADSGASWTGPSKALAALAPGGYGFQLIADPSEPATVYAATGGGMFVSRDAGKHWAPFWIPKRDLGGSSGVCALAFDPSSTARMFSGPCGYNNYGGVYRSSDSGTTWTQLHTDWGSVTALAPDPAKPGTFYASLDYGGLPAVVVTRDAGDTWTNAAYTSVPFSARTLSVAGDGTVYAGLFFKGLRASHDGAVTWTDRASAGIPADSTVALAMDPKSRAPYLAAVAGEYGGGGVYRFAADGWRRTSLGIHVEQVWDLASDGARLYAATDSGLFATDDSGASWSAPLLAGPASAVALSRDGTLYASDWWKLHRSTDRGRTWTDLRESDPAFHYVADPGEARRLYAYAYRLERSDDGGSTWTTLFPPSGTFAPGVGAFAVLRDDPQTMFLWSNGNARAADGTWIVVDSGLKRSRDAGATWTSVGADLSAQGVSCAGLILDPAARLFLALNTGLIDHPHGHLYRSDDAGLTWRELLPSDGDVIQAIARSADGALFAALPGAVWTSTDGGDSWRAIADGKSTLHALLPDPTRGVLFGATWGDSIVRAAPRH